MLRRSDYAGEGKGTKKASLRGLKNVKGLITKPYRRGKENLNRPRRILQ